MSANNGGPAFPVIETNPRDVGAAGNYTTIGDVSSHGGMTLRDYFAAKAMQAGHGLNIHHTDYVARAKEAYKLADAMLAARGDA